jgi:hypothetical protein
MLLMQFGNLSKETTMKNTRLFAEKCMPHLRDIWGDWEDKWWIKPISQQQSPRAISVG